MLPAEERADLVVQLLDSLEGEAPSAAELAEIEKAWEEETRRIVRELDEGRMDCVPWEEVREQVFGKK